MADGEFPTSVGRPSPAVIRASGKGSPAVFIPWESVGRDARPTTVHGLPGLDLPLDEAKDAVPDHQIGNFPDDGLLAVYFVVANITDGLSARYNL